MSDPPTEEEQRPLVFPIPAAAGPQMELLESAVDQWQSDMESIGSPSTLLDEEAIRKRAASQEVDDLRASEEQLEQGPTSPSAQRMYPVLFAGNVEVMPQMMTGGYCCD